MTKLYRWTATNDPTNPNTNQHGYVLANDETDAKTLVSDSGHNTEVAVEDVTEKKLYDMDGLTLKSLIESNARGLAYHRDRWFCVPLEKDQPGLHANATQHAECWRCNAQKGEPCKPSHGFPIMEGTAHRVRVRAYIRSISKPS